MLCSGCTSVNICSYFPLKKQNPVKMKEFLRRFFFPAKCPKGAISYFHVISSMCFLRPIGTKAPVAQTVLLVLITSLSVATLHLKAAQGLSQVVISWASMLPLKGCHLNNVSCVFTPHCLGAMYGRIP